MTAYDYVVVGAGVAGSLTAARLSRHPGTTVLLLEAGGRVPDGPAARDPAQAHLLWGTDADWSDETVPQPGLGGRTVRWPAGRALGGSSVLNAALWVPGHDADYDAWAAYGGTGWDSGSARRALHRLTPAGGGPLPVEAAPADAWTSRLTSAAAAAGFPPSDPGGPHAEGFA
ncbi:MAG: GMC family oxidoreductase, partial [Streptomyces sp.]|nr:GMC family oxidoreductase [Streptomyces sp.]